MPNLDYSRKRQELNPKGDFNRVEERSMTEPTIICPQCKTEIKLTESLAEPLIEATRKQFEKQLAQKDSAPPHRSLQWSIRN